MVTEIIFDLETKKIFDDIQGSDPADLGVSIVSLYLRHLNSQLEETDGQLYSFWEEEFSKMWPLFTNVNRIIGFNSLKFDVSVLAPLSPFDFRKLAHFDILDHIKELLGHRLSLNTIAAETVQHTKTDNGLNAVYYWQQGTPESLAKLKKYCEADVLVTRDVYDYGLKHGHLKYTDKWNTPRLIEVDFSYPKLSSPQSQMGLF